MLETLGDYALAHLTASGEEKQLRQWHAAYFLELAEAAELQLQGAEQVAWMAQLTAEHGNLRAALTWSQLHAPEIGLRLAGALWWFWWGRGHVDEGWRWLDAVLARGAGVPVPVLAKALHGAGWLAVQQQDYTQGAALLEQSLAHARESRETGRVAAVLQDFGQAPRLRGIPGERPDSSKRVWRSAER